MSGNKLIVLIAVVVLSLAIFVLGDTKKDEKDRQNSKYQKKNFQELLTQNQKLWDQ